MKKTLVTSIPNTTPLIAITACRTDLYYGAIMKGPHKAFIAREQYETGNYHLLSCSNLTEHNYYSYYSQPSLQTLLSKLLADDRKVFVFDTYQELFAWLASPAAATE